jgi:hypothetical protein
MPNKIHNDEITDEETPLPLHLLFLEEMPRPVQLTRQCQSDSAHSPQYRCETFYKAISRPFRAATTKGTGDAK